ncbi:hypothetical protein F4779DRAFT_598603 [Xylariaceae sp. FL0662B]|nr:hypothetical protein F4779DRAFT_598603 [Xylariaceae sp. FL0662B]
MAERTAFAPFLTGPRSCAGKSMAYLETSLVMAKTLWYCDFEKAAGKLGQIGDYVRPGTSEDGRRENEYLLRDIVVSTHQDPYLKFHPRDSLQKEIS